MVRRCNAGGLAERRSVCSRATKAASGAGASSRLVTHNTAFMSAGSSAESGGVVTVLFGTASQDSPSACNSRVVGSDTDTLAFLDHRTQFPQAHHGSMLRRPHRAMTLAEDRGDLGIRQPGQAQFQEMPGVGR